MYMKYVAFLFLSTLLLIFNSCSKSNPVSINDIESDNVPTRVKTDSIPDDTNDNDTTGLGGTIIDWETVTEDITVTED